MRRSLLALLTSLAVAVPLLSMPAQAADDSTADPGLSTMERRALRLEMDDLGKAEQSRTAALLARPEGDQWRDFEHVRVHWAEDEATSTYVDQVGEVADHVLDTYAAAGYRAPEPDDGDGGNDLLDIYLLDLGARGLYGYCDTDDPPTGSGPFDAPAYCAFDDDYAEFPGHPQLENLEVTAAHELFHAVQFAYDYLEDVWFMEATATWAEDEVYDDVDDNRQYLASSPLTQPAVPIDLTSGLRVYGGWIFFRYLTERHPAAEGGMPVLVRSLWERADSDPVETDDYSVEALRHELASSDDGLRAVWARFAAANRHPATSYDEGSHYRAAPLAGTVRLSGARRGSGDLKRVIDHLAAATVRFDRAPRMAARTLRLRLDLPNASRGSGAVATIRTTSGHTSTVALTQRLAGNGNAVASVPFGRSVSWVEVTLANAGSHYRSCWNGGLYSCEGHSTDDDLPFRVRATALR